jgi:hypothetical protein
VRSSARAAGVFAGFSVSSSLGAGLSFAVFFVLPAVSFVRDFFCAAFGLGVGVCRRFDFDDALGAGVSRGVGDATGFSSSPDFSLLVLRSALGLGDFLGVTEASKARCLFADLLVAVFALGVGDFFGLGNEAVISFDSDSSRRLFCSSLTCARRRPVTIAPRASAVASQMRKRTTATERNRAREAINGIVKKLKKIYNAK